MRPTLRQLEYLVAVADTGRFGLAADRLNVSQPSLSAQIADVETELGARLFLRGRNGATLTATGTDVVQRARRILNDVEDLRAAIHGNGIFEGRLRFGVLPTIGPYLLPNIVRHLHRSHPEFRLVVREESTSDLEQGLNSGRLDMVISTIEDHPGTHADPLFEEDLWAAVARDDPLAEQSGPLPIDHLANRTLLTLGLRHRLARIVAVLAAQCGGLMSDDYEGTSLDAIRLMAAAGAGVAILPRLYVATEAVRRSDIVLRRIDHPLARRQLALIQPSGPSPRPGSDMLARALTQEADALMGPPSAPLPSRQM